MHNDEDRNWPLVERIVEFIESTKQDPPWKVSMIFMSIGGFAGLVYCTLRALILHL